MLENSLQLGGNLVFTSLFTKTRNLPFCLGNLVLNIFIFGRSGLGFSFRLDKESRAATTICVLASVTIVARLGTVRSSGRRRESRTGGMGTGGEDAAKKRENGRRRGDGGWTPRRRGGRGGWTPTGEVVAWHRGGVRIEVAD